MLHEIDDALIALLADDLSRTPGCPIYDRRHITLDTPGEALRIRDGEASVNLYLYDVRENAQLRDEGYQTVARPTADNENRAGRRLPPKRLDLAYLITTHAGSDIRLEHRLLSDVFASLFRASSIPAIYLSPALLLFGNCLVTLQVAFPGDISRADLSSIWQALDGTQRPSIHLIVTAPFDPYTTKWTQVVRESPRVALVPAASTAISGIVLDAESETPLAAVVVNILSETAGSPAKVLPDGTLPQSDETGIFVLPALPHGNYLLRLVRHGYRTANVSISVPSNLRTTMPPLVVALRADMTV